MKTMGQKVPGRGGDKKGGLTGLLDRAIGILVEGDDQHHDHHDGALNIKSARLGDGVVMNLVGAMGQPEDHLHEVEKALIGRIGRQREAPGGVDTTSFFTGMFHTAKEIAGVNGSSADELSTCIVSGADLLVRSDPNYSWAPKVVESRVIGELGAFSKNCRDGKDAKASLIAQAVQEQIKSSPGEVVVVGQTTPKVIESIARVATSLGDKANRNKTPSQHNLGRVAAALITSGAVLFPSGVAVANEQPKDLPPQPNEQLTDRILTANSPVTILPDTSPDFSLSVLPSEKRDMSKKGNEKPYIIIPIDNAGKTSNPDGQRDGTNSETADRSKGLIIIGDAKNSDQAAPQPESSPAPSPESLPVEAEPLPPEPTPELPPTAESAPPAPAAAETESAAPIGVGFSHQGKVPGTKPLVWRGQHESQWADEPYRHERSRSAEQNISLCGCGPTSIAMAASSLTGKDIYPDDMADTMMDMNANISESRCGSKWIFVENSSTFEKQYGIRIENLSNNAKAFKSVIDSGGIVLMSQGNGAFIKGNGHLLTITGYINLPDSEGGGYNFLVGDPNDNNPDVKSPRKHTENLKGFSPSTVEASLKNAWAIYPTSPAATPVVAAAVAVPVVKAAPVEAQPPAQEVVMSAEQLKRQQWINAAEEMATLDDQMGRAGAIMLELLRDTEMGPKQISGFIGNFWYESAGLHSSMIQGGGRGPAAGLAQWEHIKKAKSRFGQLKEFAESQGTTWADFDTQVKFVIKELKSTEKKAYKRVLETTSPEASAVAVRKFYERSSVHRDEKRVSYANDAYGEFKKILDRQQSEGSVETVVPAPAPAPAPAEQPAPAPQPAPASAPAEQPIVIMERPPTSSEPSKTQAEADAAEPAVAAPIRILNKPSNSSEGKGEQTKKLVVLDSGEVAIAGDTEKPSSAAGLDVPDKVVQEEIEKIRRQEQRVNEEIKRILDSIHG